LLGFGVECKGISACSDQDQGGEPYQKQMKQWRFIEIEEDEPIGNDQRSIPNPVIAQLQGG
jgi:hypothetical protein